MKQERTQENKQQLTEIVFILDASGSMHCLEEDTIGGFNSILDKQKKLDGDAFVSTVLFNSTSRVIHDRMPIQTTDPMTDHDYSVGGCTALNYASVSDAICCMRTENAVGTAWRDKIDADYKHRGR